MVSLSSNRRMKKLTGLLFALLLCVGLSGGGDSAPKGMNDDDYKAATYALETVE